MMVRTLTIGHEILQAAGQPVAAGLIAHQGHEFSLAATFEATSLTLQAPSAGFAAATPTARLRGVR
jgi:hypothetical protein